MTGVFVGFGMFGAMMTSRDSWPVTIALNNVAGGQSVPFGQAMAGALLVSLPTLAIYVLLGRVFMRGTSSTVKMVQLPLRLCLQSRV